MATKSQNDGGPLWTAGQQGHQVPEEVDHVLYSRDEQTGEHCVTHAGEERRFATRSEALALARELATKKADTSGD